jgi:hypothetical protein
VGRISRFMFGVFRKNVSRKIVESSRCFDSVALTELRRRHRTESVVLNLSIAVLTPTFPFQFREFSKCRNSRSVFYLETVWNDLNGAERLNPSIGLRAGYSERLEREPFFGKHQGSHIPRALKKGIRKILTGTSVPLDTCLLTVTP